ncbi:hypothetical protein NVP1178O_39 [Vibrio phage 1.178.O._10N.286.45.E12]|nr:hypothetical protein NVP1178O_39 [Vibrio phage 1.178.O._10N.286.45.E12]
MAGMSTFLSSCSSTPAICDIIEPVTVSKNDSLTKETKESIVKTNLLIERVCD